MNTNGLRRTRDSAARRIVTAAILIPFFVIFLLKASATVFAVVTALAVFWAAVEWVGLLGVRLFPYGVLYPVVLLFLLRMVYLLMDAGVIVVPAILFMAWLWWFLAAVLVCIYPKGASLWGKYKTVKGVMGVFCLVPCWVALIYIRESFISGRNTLLFVFLLVWAADVGAWFAGRRWGRRKLIPAVSPGKTWEGLAGGLIAAAGVTLLAMYWNEPKPPWFIWVGGSLLCLMTVLFSMLGDLFESMLKRMAGKKDSGSLLPGHGGLLDRIDSLLAAAPVFVCGAMLLDIFLRFLR